MLTSKFDYQLPESLIAKFPPKNRGEARLLVLDRAKKSWEHHVYRDIPGYMNNGDTAVINVTRVEKKRFALLPKEGSGEVEILILYPIDSTQQVWNAIVGKANRIFKKGIRSATLETKDKKFHLDVERFGEFVRVDFGDIDLREFTQVYGQVPIPPYLKRDAVEEDEKRYNTVFARVTGSSAAPTASLNLNAKILENVRDRDCKIAEVVLDIGWGTFAPVRSDNIEEHQIHHEHYSINRENAEMINRSKMNKKDIWAFGTTSARVLETVAYKNRVKAQEGWTELFIYPGYQWKLVDHLITNFHAPRSSLLAMVASFAGYELIMSAYQEALEQGYKFLSYGDSMLIL